MNDRNGLAFPGAWFNDSPANAFAPDGTSIVRGGSVHYSPGMSLRAYYAGQALPFVASYWLNPAADDSNLETDAELIAADCCTLADALIAELAK
jgi:hypothetical protein